MATPGYRGVGIIQVKIQQTTFIRISVGVRGECQTMSVKHSSELIARVSRSTPTSHTIRSELS